ncbi:MAG: toxin-antitoxin system YwqK family antitoxin [Vicinamibacterales bacterium]
MIASRSLAGAGYCDGNPDLCPHFGNQCPKVKEGEIHFVSPLSGETHDGYWRNGLPDGIAAIHDKNGKLFATGQYVNGKADGLWKHYLDGNLTSESLFADGHYVYVLNTRTNDRSTWTWEGDKLVAREVSKNGTPIQKFTYEEGDGETTMVEFEYSNGQWVKKAEKKYPQVEIGDPCPVC